jgi:hypothetical protein
MEASNYRHGYGMIFNVVITIIIIIIIIIHL